MRDKMSDHAHYFWAVRIPDEIKQQIQLEMKKLQQTFLFKRWVHMNDYHITLAFLGSINHEKRQHVIELVGEAFEESQPFSLQILGLNVFGKTTSPRIFWAAVSDESKLLQLQAIVHKKCQEAGMELESRPYHPHITLARKWIGQEESSMGLLQKFNPFQEKPLSFLVNEIVLYKTNMDETPKYEIVYSHSLDSEKK